MKDSSFSSACFTNLQIFSTHISQWKTKTKLSLIKKQGLKNKFYRTIFIANHLLLEMGQDQQLSQPNSGSGKNIAYNLFVTSKKQNHEFTNSQI